MELDAWRNLTQTMKITLLANRDVASCLAVNYLLRDLQEHRLTLFLSSRVGSKPLAEPLQHLKFVEQDLFNQLLFPLLASTVRTRPADKADKAYKAYKKERLLGFDELAEHLD